MGDTTFIYKMVTDKIVAQLESGVVPWHKPWTEANFPRSIDGHKYRGINVFLLGVSGYTSPYWVTWKGAKRHGGQIKEVETKNATTVIWWKMLKFRDKLTDEELQIPHLQYYRVYNWEQTEGVKEPKGGAFPAANSIEHTTEDRHESALALVLGYPNTPRITHGGDRAFYEPGPDRVNLPNAESFDTLDDYYSAMFHELTHSTAHKSRLDRDCDYNFGSHKYGREELVAEMGAAFLTAECGIVATHSNSAAYLQSWIDTIKVDVKAVIGAAGKAQRAADYILNRKHESEELAA